MNSNDNNMLQEIITIYRNELPQHVEEITKLWTTLLDTWNDDAFEEFLSKIHNMAGSAGMLGFNQFSKIAGETQTIIRASANPHKPTQDEINQISENITKLSIELREIDKQ